ncbi:MAG: DNA-3-methyladenine glycosylase I [Cellvibrionaceae bacterium]|jgi:DNA-3-methyladenine glycosylase I
MIKTSQTSTAKTRCGWCNRDPLYFAYHDEEWGVPLRDDRKLFEFVLLEGAQAGLSWITVLRKRENYRDAFDAFDPQKIARYDDKKIQALLQDTGIIRNRLKVNGFVKNARAYLKLLEKEDSFNQYIWQFVEGRRIQNHWKDLASVPVSTKAAETMSKTMKKAGFTFWGPTICYAFMQATGMVNDHLIDCFRHRELSDRL